MIEKTVIDYLNFVLTPPVGAQTPEGPPSSYVVVERTGGGEKEGLSAAVLAIRCVAPSLYAAIDLCAEAGEAMKQLPERTTNVFSAYPETVYNQTDTRTKEYRYTAIFRVFYIEGSA